MKKVLATSSVFFGIMTSAVFADETTKLTNTQVDTISVHPMEPIELSETQMDTVSAGAIYTLQIHSGDQAGRAERYIYASNHQARRGTRGSRQSATQGGKDPADVPVPATKPSS